MSESRTGRPAPSTPGRTLERERELARIRWVLDQAAGGQGRLLVIEGPSGIGKSHLLEQARALAGEAGIDVLRARGGELERGYPFGLVLRLLEGPFARGSATAKGRLSRGPAALAAPLLSQPEEHAGHAATTDEFSLVHGLYWCVLNLAEERPLALLVDDVHWADDLSLRFLIYLAHRLEDLPVAVIVAVRAGDPTAESPLVAQLSSAGAEGSVHPVELSLAAVGDVLASAGMPGAENEAFVRAAWRTTGGNPFLLRELVAALRAEPKGLLTTDPARLEAFAPQSVARSVVLRLMRLGPDALALARAFAVLGEETPLPTAARLARLSSAAAAEAGERLMSAQILSCVHPACFAHPMIRSAVYTQLSAGERPRAHAAAARLLHEEGAASDRVAQHLLAGCPTDEPWACEALHDGARTAARRGAPEVAVRYLRHAIEGWPPGERSAPLLVDLGLVEAAAGETTSLTRFEQALATIDEPTEQARALYALGQTLYRYGRQEEAAQTFRRGAELFEHRDRQLWLMFEGALICAALYLVSLRTEASARLESLVRSIPDEGPVSAAERVVLANLAFWRAVTVAPATEAAALARRALADGALLREQTSESLAVNMAIVALVWSGRAEEAQRAVDDVLVDARQRGSALAFAEASHVRAMVMHARGRIADAAADAQAAIEGMDRGWHLAVPIPQAILAVCLIERGKPDLADTVLRSVEPTLPGPETVGLKAYFHWARGRLRLARADARGALEDFLDTGRAIAPYASVNPAIIPWRPLAGLAMAALGDRDEALRLVDEDVGLARQFALPAALGAALRIRGVIEDGPGGLETLEDAVAALEDADAPLELAYALHDLGAAHRRAGRRVACREPLRRALDLAHQCGATALGHRAREELLASGARPRRAAITGLDALTPSERRIAELAAAGKTNRSIAETLFLTKNTVDWHLRHVYRKLGVASRPALKATLERAGAPAASAEPTVIA